MNRNLARQIVLFIVLVLAQVLICNRIVLFGVASPIVFIYFLVSLPFGFNRNMVLTMAFFMGLMIDIFSDTPGMNSLACTLLSVLKGPIMSLYNPHESDLQPDAAPTLRTLGAAIYLKYLGTLVLIYVTLIFVIEYFSFISVSDILVRIICSGLLSFLLLIGIDSLLVGRKKQ